VEGGGQARTILGGTEGLKGLRQVRKGRACPITQDVRPVAAAVTGNGPLSVVVGGQRALRPGYAAPR
jgi:hypothetical protein